MLTSDKVAEPALDSNNESEVSGDDENALVGKVVDDDVVEDEEEFDGMVQTCNGTHRLRASVASGQLPEWAAFNLHPLIARSLHKQNFSNPTPIQKSALPAALKGKDVVGIAETVCSDLACILTMPAHIL